MAEPWQGAKERSLRSSPFPHLYKFTALIAVQVQAFRIIYQTTTLYSEGIPDCAEQLCEMSPENRNQ
jgi:hypothetical protein